MDLITIAQAQCNICSNKNDTIVQFKRLCKKARSAHADLLMLPEMFCCPYDVANFPVYAEPEGGALWTAASEAAKEHSLYIVAGSMPEQADDGRIYNTSYVFDCDGRQIAKHRKIHLFDISVPGGQTFFESDTLSAGSSVTTFDTEWGVIGLCICFDFRFPELGRNMAHRGARLILVPAAFNMTTGPAHWELTFRAQALFNQFFVVGTAPARDLSSAYISWGHSIAVGPWGNVLCQLDEKEAMQIVTMNLAEVSMIREQLPLMKQWDCPLQ